MIKETKVCGYEWGNPNQRSYLNLFRREFDDGIVFDIDFTRDNWKSVHNVTRRLNIEEALCHFHYHMDELPKSFPSVIPVNEVNCWKNNNTIS
jgi:hypothetical protein